MAIDGQAATGMYPPAPWWLEGWGVAAVALLDAVAAARYVPAGLRLVTLVPGKTLGGLFFLSYERGSLVYHELNIVAGLVRIGTRCAFLLPRLYVDSAASLAGGREIWGVSKALAAFEIERADANTTVAVRHAGREVCRLRYAARGPKIGSPFPFPLPSLGVRDDEYLFFTGTLRTTVGLAAMSVDWPRDGEFGSLGLERPFMALRCDKLRLTVPAPQVVKRQHMPIARANTI